jgi:hypothetical protein
VKNSDLSELHNAAQDYGRRGIPVFPLYGVNATGHCSCTEGANCGSAGKHPLTQNGHKNATTDEKQIAKWWTDRPTANIGITTGHKTGWIVLDVDPRHGGIQSIEQLDAKFGTLPHTRTVKTGSGGWHYYFKHSDVNRLLPNRTSVAGYKGIDFRGDGGYVVAPPSRHSNGNIYVWADESEAAACPPWLSHLIVTVQPQHDGESARSTAEILGGVPEGERRNALLRIVGKLRRIDLPIDFAEYLALVAANNCSPPFDESEALDLVQDVYKRYPIGPKSAGDLWSLSSPTDSRGWPEPPSDAYSGLAGEIVNTIEPQTESDPVAILIQLLVGFGNAAGRNAFYRVEADNHYPNMYALLVGETAKGRKGTSWGHVARLFEVADPNWKDSRIVSGLSSGEGLISAVTGEQKKTKKGAQNNGND